MSVLVLDSVPVSVLVSVGVPESVLVSVLALILFDWCSKTYVLFFYWFCGLRVGILGTISLFFDLIFLRLHRSCGNILLRNWHFLVPFFFWGSIVTVEIFYCTVVVFSETPHRNCENMLLRNWRFLVSFFWDSTETVEIFYFAIDCR